jgi:general secretion pathway protein L
MVRDFAEWWARQMRELLPRTVLSTLERADALLVTAQTEWFSLAVRRRGRETALGQFRTDEAGVAAARAAARAAPRRVVLSVPSDLLLERQVELPLAAERDLAGILSYEMNSLTPFAAEDVIWQTAMVKRDAAQRRLQLRLTLVPRSALRPCLDLLARLGVTADGLEATAGDGSQRRLALAGPGKPAGRRLTTALAGAAGILAVAVVVTPFVMQSLARKATERAIAALAPDVAKATAMRKRLADGIAGAGILAEEQARIGDVLQVLAALTEIVPDDSWLSDLSMRQGKLNFSGESPAAARLIPALAADPDFHNPAFAAPVVRSPSGRAEQFVIRADLAP